MGTRAEDGERLRVVADASTTPFAARGCTNGTAKRLLLTTHSEPDQCTELVILRFLTMGGLNDRVVRSQNPRERS